MFFLVVVLELGSLFLFFVLGLRWFWRDSSRRRLLCFGCCLLLVGRSLDICLVIRVRRWVCGGRLCLIFLVWWFLVM